MTCVIAISLLQFGQISIVGTTELGKLMLMTLPYARQNVGASKRLTQDWVPVNLKRRSWNWPGRFATAARSSTLCAYCMKESRKNDRRRSSMSPRWYTSAITGLPIAITAPGPPAVVPQGVADGASVLLVIACPQRNQRHFQE